MTSSQCKTWRRKWVSPQSYLPQFDTTQAAALRTRCSLTVVSFGEPASRPTHSSRRGWRRTRESRRRVVTHECADEFGGDVTAEHTSELPQTSQVEEVCLRRL